MSCGSWMKGSRCSAAEVLTISFPLNLPKAQLERRFRELLRQHHKGRRGVQYAKSSNALYKVQGQPNVPALALGFEVWLLRKERPDLTQWEIGNRIPGLLRTQKIKPDEERRATEEKRRALASAVSRYLKRVDSSIERAGRGLFP